MDLIKRRPGWTGGPFAGKMDALSAFRNVPLKPQQFCWLMMMVIDPKTGKELFFFDKCLPFGASISCAIFQKFSNALKYLAEKMSGRIYVFITNYLDDFLFITYTKTECNSMLKEFLVLCSRVGCPISTENTEWADQMMVFLGILLDLIRFRLILPQEKQVKALTMIRSVVEKKKITVKKLQSLTGTLNFLNRAIVPGRVFTRCMYAKATELQNSLKVKKQQLKPYHHI